MFKRSKIKRTIGWCWDNGKSFEIGGEIVNCAKLGADINLNAAYAVNEDFIEQVAPCTVYYYYYKKDTK